MTHERAATPVPSDPARTEIESFRLAPGFRAAATACGLKESGALDLALIVAESDCAAAGVFTTNAVRAAPVLHDHDIVARGPSDIRAVIANSGCANACTGDAGLADTRRTAELAARAIGCRPDQVLVLSTGVIGRRLAIARVEQGIHDLAAALGLEGAADLDAPGSSSSSGSARGATPPANGAGGLEAARAIMTTDTHPKVASADAATAAGAIAVRGIAKGAGMIHPDMATMLAVITTDARCDPTVLDHVLRHAVRRSFNRISVDGDMSTNDTVLMIASGVSSAAVDPHALPAFQAAVDEVCVSLARQIARDGEGATRLVEITVERARTEEEAHQVADAIARSLLVKTAIHGGDPNWGRILAAAGASGVEIDPERLSLVFGETQGRGAAASAGSERGAAAGAGSERGSAAGAGSERGAAASAAPVTLVTKGLPAGADPARAAAKLAEDPVHIRLDLGLGGAAATVWTCDLSADYVAINAHYTT